MQFFSHVYRRVTAPEEFGMYTEMLRAKYRHGIFSFLKVHGAEYSSALLWSKVVRLSVTFRILFLVAHVKIYDRAIQVFCVCRPIYPVGHSQIGQRRARSRNENTYVLHHPASAVHQTTFWESANIGLWSDDQYI